MCTGGGSVPEQKTNKGYHECKNFKDNDAVRKLRVLFILNIIQFVPRWRGLSQGKNSDLFEAVSAGSDPRGVHPLTVLVMDGIGIEIS
jgi:hypothetical protein